MPDERTSSLVVEPEHTDPWLHRFGSPGMSWCIVRELEPADSAPGGDDAAGGELETVIHAWVTRAKGDGTEWVARISGPYHDVVRSTERLFRGEVQDAAVAMAVGEAPASVTLAAVVESDDLHLLVRRAWHHRLTLALLRVRHASGAEAVAALDHGDDGRALALADRVLVCQAAVRSCSLGSSDSAALEGLPARQPAYILAPQPGAPKPALPARPRAPGIRVGVGLSIGLIAAAVAAIVLFSGALRSAPSSSGPTMSVAANATSARAATPATTSLVVTAPAVIPSFAPAPTPVPSIPAAVQLSSFPPQRTGAAVAFDAAHATVVLFGGTGGTTSVLGDTWLFSNGAWAQAHSRTSPSPRTAAAMTYNPPTGHVVLVGGTSASGAGLDDTWIWDGTTWSQISVRTPPAAGPPVALAYDGARQSLVLLTRAAGGPTAARTWTFASGTWKLQPAAAATTASAGAALVDDTALGRLVLVDVASGVTRTWDGTVWTDVPGASTPTGAAAQAAYDAAAKQVVLVVAAQGQPPSTWTFDGAAWRQAVSATGPANVGALASTTTQVLAFGGVSAADDFSQPWRWSAAGWGG